MFEDLKEHMAHADVIANHKVMRHTAQDRARVTAAAEHMVAHCETGVRAAFRVAMDAKREGAADLAERRADLVEAQRNRRAAKDWANAWAFWCMFNPLEGE